MPGLKLSLIVVLITGGLIVWKFSEPDRDSALPTPTKQVVPVHNKPSNIAGGNHSEELLKRIEQLEAEVISQKSSQQVLAEKVTQLEHNIAQAQVHQQSNPEPAQKDLRPNSHRTDVDPQQLEQSLLSAGLALETIQAIRQQVDQNQLEMLELRNRAFREDWDESLEFSEKMMEVSDANRGLREQFGDQNYDQYLYASGQPNRVIVREVYSGSAAFQAGIQPGDIFLRYASENIYSMSALRDATLAGESGEIVLIETEREGRRYSSSVTRGPLGISMTVIRIKP